MNGFEPTAAESHATSWRFPSLAAVRAAHSELLRRHRAAGDRDEIISAMDAFVRRGTASGAVIDKDSERWAAQSLIDYWSTMLYRAGHTVSDSMLVDFDISVARTLPDHPRPYRGLNAFDVEDRGLFFGRARMIEDLLGALRTKRLLGVIGPSGSGKSSLVRACLPDAQRQGVAADDDRRAVVLVPGSEPMANLARAVAPYSQPRIVLVDQFEEVFTLCSDDAERKAFVSSLLDLASTPSPQDSVVLTLRSDFEPYLARLPRLQDALADARLRISAPVAPELRDMIERPAELVGLQFEEGIVEALIKEFLGEPAGLPLLQFTLLRLWEEREANRVTWAAFRRLAGGRGGGARMILARCGDVVYEQLLPQDQVIARRIFLRLVRPTEGLEFTSGRVLRESLYVSAGPVDGVDRVLDRLARAGLIRVSTGATPHDIQVEVAHEALVRNWPRLGDWLSEQRNALRKRRSFEDKAKEWERLGRRGGLLDDVQLREAEAWLATSDAEDLGYDSALPALVTASRAALEAERHARDQDRQRELALIRSLRYWFQAASVGLGTGLGSALAYAIVVRPASNSSAIWVLTMYIVAGFGAGQLPGYGIGLGMWLGRRNKAARIVACVAFGAVLEAASFLTYLLVANGGRGLTVAQVVSGAWLGAGLGLSMALARRRWHCLASAMLAGPLGLAAAYRTAAVTPDPGAALLAGIVLGLMAGLGFALGWADEDQ